MEVPAAEVVGEAKEAKEAGVAVVIPSMTTSVPAAWKPRKTQRKLFLLSWAMVGQPVTRPR
jgi:hypothetical protein